MARGAIQVKIEGQYDDKDLNRAIKDLNRLKTDSGAATGPLGSLSGAMKTMGIVAGAMGLSSVVSGIKDFATEAISMAQESKKTNDRLEAIARSMGVFDGVLGGTTKRLTDYAQELQNATGISDETTKSGQAILLTFSELADTAGDAGGMFDRATAALLDLSAAGFGDATTNAKSLGKALQDPIKGLTALGRQGITFTNQEKEKIKALVATNQTLEAQTLIMAAVEKQVGGTAEAVATDFDKISAAADDAQELIGFALVGAFEDVIDAAGGSGGIGEAMNSAAEEVANFVTGLGRATVALTDFLVQLDNVQLGTEETSVSLLDLGKNALAAVPAIGAMYGAWTRVTGAGEDYRASQDRIDASLKGSESLYAGYISSLDGAAAGQRSVEMTADAAAEALDDMKASFDAVNGAMTAQGKMDAYRSALLGIKTAIDDTSRSLEGNNVAGLKNRDTIRDVFSTAQAAAVAWGEQNGKTTLEVEARFATMTTKIRQKLIDQGFKAEDIDTFLGGLGLWTTQTQTLASGLSEGAAASAMRMTGQAFATATKDGFDANMRPGGRAFEAMSSRMTSLAESLRRETTITVTTVNRSTYESQVPAAARRAKGGPVSANQVYLVGEEGPELFMSDSSGTIVPNGGLPSASGYGSQSGAGGSSYSITVQAGVGDPRQIGQQVVEYIRRFEQANGNVFAAA